MKVLITGASWNSGMAVARSLCAAGHRVVGVDRRTLPFNIRSRYLESYHCNSHTDELAYVRQLIEIIRSEHVDILMPYREMPIITRHKKTLMAAVKLMVPDYPAFMKAYNNEETLLTCRELGIACPQLYTDAEARELLARACKADKPVQLVAKPKHDVGAAQGVKIIDSIQELDIYRDAAGEYGDYLIQEYIPGPTRNMHTVNVLAGERGAIAAFFTTNKLQQWPTEGGITALGESTDNRPLLDFIRPFFEQVAWQGFAEAEIKIDARDGTPKLIEINPRFCGYMGFPDQCGINIPDLWCTLMTAGQLEKVPPYRVGMLYINWFAYFKASSHELFGSRDKLKTLKGIARCLRQPKVSNGLFLAELKVTLAKMVYELTAFRR